MIGKKLFYKIGEVCKTCSIEPHVLRYWESEFRVLSPTKNRAGQRIYREKDLQLIQKIKQLLYEEGFTIAGANKKLLHDDSADLPLFKQGQGPAPAKTLSTIQKDLKAILNILEKEQ
ncbi:MAG: MerR family transcriptional regulator [Acidobacteriota bacterium]